MLYKYVGAATGTGAIELLKCFTDKNTFKASEPATFNDPFEFKIAINFDADEPTVRRRYFLDNPEASKESYDTWFSTFDKSKWWVTQQTRATLLSQVGVICLSEVDDNHLMWSHYAANHQGFCVAIDERQITSVEGVLGHGKVRYRSDAPVFRFYFDDPGEFAAKALACKSHLWEYEREYRILMNKSGIVSVPRTAIQQIILGCRAYQELRMYANEHCDSRRDFWFQMCEDFAKYTIHKEPIVKNLATMSSFF